MIEMLPGHSGNYASVLEDQWDDANEWHLTRTPTFWERLRFKLTPDWQVTETYQWGGRVHEIEWQHFHTGERRRFRRGPTRFSRWRRVS